MCGYWLLASVCFQDDPNAIVFDETVYGDTDQRRGLAPTVTLTDFKVEVVAALTEYWMSEDCDEVARYDATALLSMLSLFFPLPLSN